MKPSQKRAMAWARNKARQRLDGKASSRRNGDKAYVYVFSLGFDNLYKIGMSGNFAERLRNLQAGNPNVKEIIACRMTEARLHENKLHRRFKGKLVEREIFRLDSEDISRIRNYLNARQINTDFQETEDI